MYGENKQHGGMKEAGGRQEKRRCFGDKFSCERMSAWKPNFQTLRDVRLADTLCLYGQNECVQTRTRHDTSSVGRILTCLTLHFYLHTVLAPGAFFQLQRICCHDSGSIRISYRQQQRSAFQRRRYSLRLDLCTSLVFAVCLCASSKVLLKGCFSLQATTQQ